MPRFQRDIIGGSLLFARLGLEIHGGRSRWERGMGEGEEEKNIGQWARKCVEPLSIRGKRKLVRSKPVEEEGARGFVDLVAAPFTAVRRKKWKEKIKEEKEEEEKEPFFSPILLRNGA